MIVDRFKRWPAILGGLLAVGAAVAWGRSVPEDQLQIGAAIAFYFASFLFGAGFAIAIAEWSVNFYLKHNSRPIADKLDSETSREPIDESEEDETESRDDYVDPESAELAEPEQEFESSEEFETRQGR